MFWSTLYTVNTHSKIWSVPFKLSFYCELNYCACPKTRFKCFKVYKIYFLFLPGPPPLLLPHGSRRCCLCPPPPAGGVLSQSGCQPAATGAAAVAALWWTHTHKLQCKCIAELINSTKDLQNMSWIGLKWFNNIVFGVPRLKSSLYC